MAFKTVTDYNDERYSHMFRLTNDGDSAEVIFLYQSINDVLVADTHYIKSDDYSGYVHCCGKGCPACAKGIRVQTKLFVPLYNIHDNEIQFFDRSVRFENQLQNDVFKKWSNPSELVFRITRHGASGDINTTYEITAIGNNKIGSYYDILAKFNAVMPDYYGIICKEVTIPQLDAMINQGTQGTGQTAQAAPIPDYQPVPRVEIPREETAQTAQPTQSAQTASFTNDSFIAGEDEVRF